MDRLSHRVYEGRGARQNDQGLLLSQEARSAAREQAVTVAENLRLVAVVVSGAVAGGKQYWDADNGGGILV